VLANCEIKLTAFSGKNKNLLFVGFFAETN